MTTQQGCRLCDQDHRRGSVECPSARIGKVVAGKYRLDSLMGVGGMGSVYRASHATLGTHVAIKMIHARFAANEDIAVRFDREARRVAALRHPGIVQVADLGRDDDGSPYLEMELLDGAPVDELLRAGPLPVERAIGGMVQALDALHYAHEQGIVHRDLKPENLFVVDGDAVKILDFGIAKAMQEAGDQGMTQTGSVMGTPLYMSPEQLTDAKRVDQRTDVYAMGATLYELLTAKHTVAGETYPEVMSKILTGDIAREPQAVRPELPGWIDGVVSRALAKDPAARYATAEEMKHALLAGAAGQRTDDIPRTRVPAGPQTADPMASTLAPGGSRGAAAGAGADTGVPHGVVAAADTVLPTAAAAGRGGGKGVKIGFGAAGVVAVGAVAMMALGAGGGTAGPAGAVAEAPSVPAPDAAAATPTVPDGMVAVPAGSFRMGSTPDDIDAAFAWCNDLVGDCPRDLYEREQPQRSVALSGYFLDATEVTNADYAAALSRNAVTVDAEGRYATVDGDRVLLDLDPEHGGIAWHEGAFAAVPVRASGPVVQVTWDGADWYCRAMGKRLPTEAEWERAARGTSGRMFPWGEDKTPVCDGVVYGRGEGLPCAASSGPEGAGTSPSDATPEGVKDLGGNVSEWVADRFEDRYDASCKRDCVVEAPADSPTKRVARGGYFDGAAESLRGAGRSRFASDAPQVNVGFRCAKGGEL